MAFLATLAYASMGGSIFGCAPVLVIKDLSHRNICVVENCNIRTTPEGLMCKKHWAYVPGAIKASYQADRIMAINAVKTYEEVP